MLSLRHRALIGGGLSALVSVSVGVFALYSYIDRQVLNRFDATLLDRHTQLVVALSTATQDPERLRYLVFDPAYGTPYSGRYWQVTGEDGTIYTSASLFEVLLPVPHTTEPVPKVWNTAGPDGEGVRSVYQRISYEDGTSWDISVAESLTDLAAERRDTRRSLFFAFALVGGIGLLGTSLLLSAVLGPLRKLQQDVAKRWDEDEELRPEDYPGEVAPLVRDINQLLHRNREIVSGARRQAADLAHALKTPTAILRNELATLSANGVRTRMAEEALQRVDAQLNRSLARMRIANTAEIAYTRTDLTHSIDRFSRLFSSMADRDGKVFEARNSKGLSVRMDAQDIEEVIGNLLDNALKWARSTVHLVAAPSGSGIEIVIEDDGPGIPEASRREALRSGARLDTSKPGTGLGLAIANDLLKAYGATLSLETSERLGGLAVRVSLPSQSDSKAA